MKVLYQNYRQQKQSSKVMSSYIAQAAAKRSNGRGTRHPLPSISARTEIQIVC